jgi:hypothetical protein
MRARYGEQVEIQYLDQGAQGVVIDFTVKAA